MTRKRILLCVCAVLCAAAVTGAVLFACWKDGRFLPDWVEWNDVEMAADLNGDGYLEAIRLENRQLEIYEDGALSYTSPEGWFISDVFTGDLDSDGVQEIVCLTWKRGSYGIAKPFWVDRDSEDFSQHVFIFHYEDGVLKDHWLSSDIGVEIEHASLDPYARLHLHAHDGQDYLCEWQDWGLSYIDDENPSMRETDYDTVSFLAVGDNIMHAGIMEEMEDPATGGYDFSPLYANVTDMVSSYDIAAVNQETPLVDDASFYSGQFPVFGTPTSAGDALADAGFDIVEAASNHAGDQGVTGIDDTISFWREKHPDVRLLGLNALPADTDAITYREENGIRFALFDYTFGLNSTADLESGDMWHVDTLADLERLKTGLGVAEGSADVSICFLHCGEEYADAPTEEEESLVAQLIDAGTDVVICTHPHVVQRTQTVTTAQGNRGLVCYSLGNFMASSTEPAAVLGAAVSLTFEKPKQAAGESAAGTEAVGMSVTGTKGALNTSSAVDEAANTDAAGADVGGTVRIASCTMIPTVSHVSVSGTGVYLLQDYTAQMADAQYLNNFGKGSVSRGSLQDQWTALTKHPE